MNKTLLLIGGLGLGAGLMYALDPERGQQRRARARAQLHTYRHRTDDFLDQAAHTIGRQTHGLLARARPSLRSQWGRRERQFLPKGQIDRDKGLLILGCLGLGAGLMYLLDPSMGKRRLALVRDKVQSYWKRQEDCIGKTAREVRNCTRGFVAEARTHLGSTEVPDNASLVARVRAQIGHVISNAGALGVTACHGCVTLSGPIPADEVYKLLSTVEGVSGVTEVINQLEVHTDREHISGLQGRNTTV